MSSGYEMMYILRTNLGEDVVKQSIKKYRDLLIDNGAENVQIKLLGRKRLAYPIEKQQEGFYVLVNYEGDGSQNAPVERMMRLSEEVLRYLTIKLEEPAPLRDDNFDDFSESLPATSIEPDTSPEVVETAEDAAQESVTSEADVTSEEE